MTRLARTPNATVRQRLEVALVTVRDDEPNLLVARMVWSELIVLVDERPPLPCVTEIKASEGVARGGPETLDETAE